MIKIGGDPCTHKLGNFAPSPIVIDNHDMELLTPEMVEDLVINSWSEDRQLRLLGLLKTWLKK